VTQSVADNLKACGISTKLISTTPDDFYGKFLTGPATAKEGKWDLAAPGWGSDWPGPVGRPFFVPLFDGRTCGEGSVNYGCYNSPITNKLIDQALAAKTPEESGKYWAQADQQVMKDAAFVPFMEQQTPTTVSSRVHNAQFLQTANTVDYTNLWLSK
jgi:peptide/nickel transport system substrate-binding protein